MTTICAMCQREIDDLTSRRPGNNSDQSRTDKDDDVRDDLDVNRIVRLSEAATITGLSKMTLRRYADAGKIPAIILPGGERRFLMRDIEALVSPRNVP